MTCTIIGDRNQLVFSLDETGEPTCYGQLVPHYLRPTFVDDFKLLEKILDGKCNWTLTKPTAKKEIFVADMINNLHSPILIRFKDRVAGAPDTTHSLMSLNADSGNICVTMVVPATTFHHMQRLLDSVLRDGSLYYQFNCSFIGFPKVGHQSNEGASWPTTSEFIAGKVYVDSGVSLRIGRRIQPPSSPT